MATEDSKMAKPGVYIPLLLALALVITAAASYGVVSSQSGNGKYDADGDVSCWRASAERSL